GPDSMGSSLDNELNAYKLIENSTIKHPGGQARARFAVRALLDSFHVDGPNGPRR
ncbi:hypothetical protein E4U28_001327, partial [Claviceps purpurea]